jgi:hypothetical protein
MNTYIISISIYVKKVLNNIFCRSFRIKDTYTPFYIKILLYILEAVINIVQNGHIKILYTKENNFIEEFGGPNSVMTFSFTRHSLATLLINDSVIHHRRSHTI